MDETRDADRERGPISVKFPPELLSMIDFWIERGAYDSRSEFIKDAVRDKLDSLESKDRFYRDGSVKE